MPDRFRRITIGHWMIAIAVVALLLAVGRYVLGLAILLSHPLVLGGVSVLVARWRGLTRWRAATWTCAAYPGAALVMSLGLGIMGSSIPTNSSLGVAAALAFTWVYLGAPIYCGLNVVLSLSQALFVVERGGPDQGAEVCRLILIPLASWGVLGGGFALLASVSSWLDRSPRDVAARESPTMPDRPRRLTLGHLMGLVAVVAVACAAVRWVGIGPVAVLVGLAGLVEVAARRWRLTRSRAALWVGTAYPWLGLAAAFFVMEVILPHPLARNWSPVVEEMVLSLVRAMIPGAPILLLATVCLVLWQLGEATRSDPPRRGVGVFFLVAAPMISWGIAFLVFAALWVMLDD